MSLIFARNKYEENEPIFDVIVALILMFILESVFYKMQKDKVKLFLSLKIDDL